jgi:hypothetical protein
VALEVVDGCSTWQSPSPSSQQGGQ